MDHPAAGDAFAAGAGEVPMAAAAPAGAVAVPVAVAAAQPAAGAARPTPDDWTRLRLRWALALFVLGVAAAALAMFAINSSPTAAALGACGAPTDEEAAALRDAAEQLLLAAAAQVLGATVAVLVPACQLFTILGTVLGWMTSYCASGVLWMLVACHGQLHGDLRVYYGFFLAMSFVAFLIGFILSLCGPSCST